MNDSLTPILVAVFGFAGVVATAAVPLYLGLRKARQEVAGAVAGVTKELATEGTQSAGEKLDAALVALRRGAERDQALEARMARMQGNLESRMDEMQIPLDTIPSLEARLRDLTQALISHEAYHPPTGPARPREASRGRRVS